VSPLSATQSRYHLRRENSGFAFIKLSRGIQICPRARHHLLPIQDPNMKSADGSNVSENYASRFLLSSDSATASTSVTFGKDPSVSCTSIYPRCAFSAFRRSPAGRQRLVEPSDKEASRSPCSLDHHNLAPRGVPAFNLNSIEVDAISNVSSQFVSPIPYFVMLNVA